MKIKDIVNKDLVNLTNCDQEPIHIPGSIQPHGFLLAVNKETLAIRFCSGNSIDFTGLTHHQLLGKNIGEVFGKSCSDHLTAIKNDLPGQLKAFRLEFAGKELELVTHISDNAIIIESEQSLNNVGEKNDLFDLSRQFIGYMEEAHTLKQLCSLVADGVQKITGYDRVMIYRFDKEYNGEVIAENKREDLESFMGLHYPHTDIPAQARELYIKNLLRIIIDVNYTPVPLYTIDDADATNLDLSYSVLRSVSPIHVQYLHNIGVGATLTISLIHKKKLWGLIACHHYLPKYLSHETRMAAKLQGHFITSQIEVLQLNEGYVISEKANEAAAHIISRQFDVNRDSIFEMVKDPDMLALCKATGVSVLLGGRVYKYGLVPEDEAIRRLATYLGSYTNNSQFVTDSLIKILPELKSIAAATPGINYHSLDKLSNNCIIWYRPETVSEVNWAGDPNKAIEKDKNGLSPRKSFEQWSQTVQYQSMEWLKAEVTNASNFTNALQKHLSFIFLAEQEEKQRLISEKLRETNSELENINWISTHDLQEPLRKIQVITSFMMSEEDKELSVNTQEKLQRINKAADRMQVLIKDILKYTKLKENSEGFERVNLGLLISQVVEETEESLKTKNAKVTASGLPEIKGVPFLLKQLFSNLIYNSLKFAHPQRTSEIKLSMLHDDPAFYTIKYSDNGIGFSSDYNESIFKIFTRLHSTTEFPGSGIGLALCKKIMDTHKGTIRAEGTEGTGAAFFLYFPK